MAFLELNGFSICTNRGGDMRPNEIGDRKRAYDGTARKSIRAVKKEWSFSTVRDSEYESEAFKGTIRGDGDCWHMDGDGYSTRGGPEQSGGVRTFHDADAADGDPVNWVKAAAIIPAAKYGSGSVEVDDPANNILLADSRDAENAPTGYVAINGATLSGDVTHYWQGTKSVKCVCDAIGAADGVATAIISPGAGSATKKYWASVYVKGAVGGENISYNMYDATNAVVGTIAAFTIPAADTWYRLFTDITIGALDCTSLQFFVFETVPASAITFYCDGFQIEQNTYPTSWYDGNRSGAGLMRATVGATQFVRDATDLTINVWSTGSYWTDDVWRDVLSINTALGLADNRIRLQHRTDGAFEDIRVTTAVDGVFPVSMIGAAQVWDWGWHMYTLVLRRNFETGENERELYYDGVLIASDAVGGRAPTLAASNQIFFACWGAASELNGRVDDVQVLPFAATAAQVAAWAAMGQAMSDLPYLIASGDFINADSVIVLGEVVSMPYRAFADGAAGWRSNAREVSFELREK
jgi:hypothetical protein